MDYKKKYEEALAHAREIHRNEVEKRRDMEFIFPELAESEDERIRGAIIDHLKDNNLTEWAAWLEKQGEDKEINNFDVLPGLYKCIHRMFDGTPDSKLLFEVGNVYKCLSKHDRAEFEVSYGHSVYLEDPVVCKHFIPFEKQGEQKEQGKSALESIKEEKVDNQNCVKPADKVEPKFNVDDTIKITGINNGHIGCSILNTEDGFYYNWKLVEYKPAWSEENERLRKTTIAFLKDFAEQGYENAVECIDWLEKQGQQEEPQVYETEDGEVITFSESKGYKVIKPKFKCGDWLIFDENHNSVYQVKRIDNYRYYLRHYLGGTLSVHFDNELIRLWTIQDAKDGDVLAGSYGTFILMGKSNGGYCGVLSDNTFIRSTGNNEWTEDLHPATKEQCDLLFQKMKEAGYEWDAEKKELKKILNILEECEIEHIEHGKYYYCIKDYYAGGNKRVSKGDVVKALNGMSMMALGVKANEYFIPVKNIVDVRSDWGEKDDNKVKDIIYFLDTAKKHYASTVELDACIDWLKSLKDRVHPKQDWSEEDECYMSECIGAIATKDGWSFEEKRKTKHWLKSIKQRIGG